MTSVCQNEYFAIIPEHLKLLKSLRFSSNFDKYEDIWNIYSTSGKKPYGNSSIEDDIAVMCGWVGHDEPDICPEKKELLAVELHNSMNNVINICLKLQQFETGLFLKDYHGWREVKGQNLIDLNPDDEPQEVFGGEYTLIEHGIPNFTVYDETGLEVLVRYREGIIPVPFFVNVNAMKGEWLHIESLNRIFTYHKKTILPGDIVEVQAFRNKGDGMKLLQTPDKKWTVRIDNLPPVGI